MPLGLAAAAVPSQVSLAAISILSFGSIPGNRIVPYWPLGGGGYRPLLNPPLGCGFFLAAAAFGSRTEPEWTPHGPRTDPERTPIGSRTDPERTPNGSRTDLVRSPNGSRTDPERTLNGPRTDRFSWASLWELPLASCTSHTEHSFPIQLIFKSAHFQFSWLNRKCAKN